MEMGRQEVNVQRCQESMFVLEGFQESLWHCMELELVCQSGWNLHMVHTLANIMTLHLLCVGTTWELSWIGGKQRVWVHHGRISQTLTIHQLNLRALSDDGIECSIFFIQTFWFLSGRLRDCIECSNNDYNRIIGQHQSIRLTTCQLNY
jgi:hypothetical protein